MAAKKVKKAGPGQPRMGRPQAPPQAARRNRVVTMVTDAELKKLTDLAARDQTSLSTTVHRILLGRLGPSNTRRNTGR